MSELSRAARYARIAWAALGYNLLVIAWGSYVRASGSGAGCGSHWPLCNGEVLPRAAAVKTIVEFSHRLTSGLVLVLAVLMVVLAFRWFERGSRVRKGAVVVLLLTVVEALIGAGLVLFELVAHDASMKRALSMVLHLCNTFLLLGALTLTARAASQIAAGTEREDAPTVITRAATWPIRTLFVASAAALMLVGMSGGIAALGDTLFPAKSFAEGLRQELSTGAHVLLRLRVLHPLLAAFTALLVSGTSIAARLTRPEPTVQRWSRWLSGLVVVQIALGIANLALLAPIWMQLVHLLVADVLWIAFVMLWANVSPEAAAQPLSTTRLRPERFAS